MNMEQFRHAAKVRKWCLLLGIEATPEVLEKAEAIIDDLQGKRLHVPILGENDQVFVAIKMADGEKIGECIRKCIEARREKEQNYPGKLVLGD